MAKPGKKLSQSDKPSEAKATQPTSDGEAEPKRNRHKVTSERSKAN